jgi:hypothetical protein
VFPSLHCRPLVIIAILLTFGSILFSSFCSILSHISHPSISTFIIPLFIFFNL